MTYTNNCEDCKQTGRGGSWWPFRSSKLFHCPTCNKSICSKCANNQALIPYTPNNNEEPISIQKSSIKCYCKSCYQRISTLDYSRTYDVIEPTADYKDDNENENTNTTTLIWVHGGGGCRRMFHPHAKLLTRISLHSH